jgi:hypothetical protein
MKHPFYSVELYHQTMGEVLMSAELKIRRIAPTHNKKASTRT